LVIERRCNLAEGPHVIHQVGTMFSVLLSTYGALGNLIKRIKFWCVTTFERRNAVL